MIAKGQHDNGDDNTEENNTGWILPTVNTTEVLEQQLLQTRSVKSIMSQREDARWDSTTKEQ